jgi:hypothetical protein
MYNFHRTQSRDYSPHTGVRPVGYYRSYRPLGAFWGRMGSFFPYGGPGASLFGLIRSLGVLLAILYVVAPQYVAGLNPNLVYWLSWSAMLLISLPLLRHVFVIIWSTSGIFMWLIIVGVLFHIVNNPVTNRRASTFNWPTAIPNVFDLLSYNGAAASQYRNVPPPSTFQYDRDGNQLRYVSFDDESPTPATTVVRRPAASRSPSYVPGWPFSNESSSGESRVSPSNWFSKWYGGSFKASDELGYDYEALVKKYNQPSKPSGPPSWAIKRADDNVYFPKPRTSGSSIEEDGIGGQVLGASQDMALVVERLARQTMGK